MVRISFFIVFFLIPFSFSGKDFYKTERKKKHHIDIVVPDVLKKISYKESRDNWKAVNKNRNGTVDLGRYQINTIAFMELKRVYGMDIPECKTFLEDTLMQKKYAVCLYEHNIRILKRRKKKINERNIIRSWALSAYRI